MQFVLNEAALTAAVAAVLWALSVSSWVVILYKSWWLWRVGQDMPIAQQAFWQAPNLAQALQALALLDRHALLQPVAGAVGPRQAQSPQGQTGWQDDQQTRQRQVVQSLRRVGQQIHWGQAWLACVASTAPFVGLLGTVWGLLDAMGALTEASQAHWDAWVPALSQPLHLTAVGLCVAVPALLAHHLMAPRLVVLQQSIEDFAADVMDHLHAPART